jgi:hypothetical protein
MRNFDPPASCLLMHLSATFVQHQQLYYCS